MEMKKRALSRLKSFTEEKRRFKSLVLKQKNSENRNLGYNMPKRELTGLLTVKSVIFLPIPGA